MDLSDEEFTKRHQAWTTELDALRAANDQAGFSRVYQQRNEFMVEESTGFVWLYRQK